MTLATSPRRSPMKASATIAAIALDEMTHSQDPQSLKCPLAELCSPAGEERQQRHSTHLNDEHDEEAQHQARSITSPPPRRRQPGHSVVSAWECAPSMRARR